MGANPTQALGVIVFLAAFVFLAASLATGGTVLLLLAIVGLLVAAGIFLKAKPWEHDEC